ncbi:MAG TPA: hypothetical protein VMW89_02205 [Desulfatiglandales bacterium]|nr:hypothetical protein [Desulfatiglandales bacterium]
MQKKITEYDSSIDALVAVAKRLRGYEDLFHMASEEFFDKFSKGLLEDNIDFVEWSNDYEHYMAIRLAIERHLQNVA